MKISLIIGAGQLGSRHMQGLLKLDCKQTIYMLDPSEQSLEISRQRATEIIHEHSVFFVKDYTDLPKHIDLAIIATNANIREKVTENLMKEFSVKYLVLEKVLFQKISAYENIESILKDSNTKVWVNHPRRMFNHYKTIKEGLSTRLSPVVFSAVGGNWGLGCNAIHFADLFTFLAGSEIVSMNMEMIDNDFFESKRVGFVEFTGTITGSLADGSIFSISSLAGNSAPITVTAQSETERFIVQEGGTPSIIALSQNNNFDVRVTSFEPVYQSALTTYFANDLFNNGGTCSLTTFEEASATHRFYIEGLLKKYCNLSGIHTEVCPIT